MSTEIQNQNQNQRDEEKMKLAQGVDQWTAFVITDGPDQASLRKAFDEANVPASQRPLVDFTLHPYLVDNEKSAKPFKGEPYKVGVAVRQLGYVSANNQIFNVWGYIVQEPEKKGVFFLHDGGQFQYGTLLYMCYDAAEARGVLLQMRRDSVYAGGELQNAGIEHHFAYTASICPGSGGIDEYIQHDMFPLSFPINYGSQFDAKQYIRDELDKKFKWNGDPKQQDQPAEEEEISEEPEETEGANESGTLTQEEMDALLEDGEKQKSSGGDEVKRLVP